MLLETARDYAKSITSLTWALSLFAAQQGWNLIEGWSPDKTSDEFEAVIKSMNGPCGCGKKNPAQKGEPVPASDLAASGIRVEHFHSGGHAQMSSIQ